MEYAFDLFPKKLFFLSTRKKITGNFVELSSWFNEF